VKAAHHAHSVVSLETNNGTKIIFDPFITGNEKSDLVAKDVEVDVILLTHAHADHLGDTVDIAKNNEALVVTTVEIANYLNGFGVKTHGMQPGGEHEFDFGVVKFTHAIHGSSIEIDGKPFTLGLATGILLKNDDKTVYHVGDTALYSDMQLIGERNNIDLAFIPIGDNFTMGPEDGAIAAEWLQAKKVVPIHYNTFPLIEQDPNEYVNALQDGVGFIPEIGEQFEV